MTLKHASNDVRHYWTPPVRTPRLRFKAKAPESGCVDGAWWPLLPQRNSAGIRKGNVSHEYRPTI